MIRIYTQLFGIALVGLVFASTAKAETLVIHQPDDGYYEVVPREAGYGFNAKAQRAWIDIYLHDHTFDDTDVPEGDIVLSTKVPGLSYDAATESIVYSDGALGPVVCAKIRHHHFVRRWTTIDATGHCCTRAAKSVGNPDDGFGAPEVRYNDVYFRAGPECLSGRSGG